MNKHFMHLKEKKNVVGVGYGFKKRKEQVIQRVSLVVLVEKKESLDALMTKDIIPSQIDGMPTDVIETGRIIAQVDRTKGYRPAFGGLSIGHYAITAGTLGVVVFDEYGRKRILSNNHVLADSNLAKIGDPIYQPGAYDGGSNEDIIGYLADYRHIYFEGEQPSVCQFANTFAQLGNTLARVAKSTQRVKAYSQAVVENSMDAAIAYPEIEENVLTEILEIGEITGVKEAQLQQSVRKSGRTTGLSFGTITTLDVTVRVNYGDERVATFSDQILTDNMSQGGDSGSLLVDGQENKAVGLLFAGSNLVTIFNPIDTVLTTFGLRFDK